jgi:hypothetical protein
MGYTAPDGKRMRLSEKNMEASTSRLRWMESEERPEIPYILKSNLQTFYSFKGLKIQTQITIMCGLDLRSRAGFWKNNGAAVCAIRTIQYNNLLFYLLLIIHQIRHHNS